MVRWIVCLVMMLAGLSGALADEPRRPGPVDALRVIYDGYRSNPTTGPEISGVYSARLQALIDADEAATPDGEVGAIDWDVFIGGNAWEISRVRLDIVAQSSERAVVRARFTNFRQPKDIAFDMVRENGQWLIDDIRTTNSQGPWSMVKTLTDAAVRQPQ